MSHDLATQIIIALSVPAGIMAGLLAVNNGRNTETRPSPWPLITGIVALGILMVVAGVAT